MPIGSVQMTVARHKPWSMIAAKNGPRAVQLVRGAIAKTVCPSSLIEATHPRCFCEGCPDGPGRASRQGGRVVANDSEAYVAFDTSKLRHAVAEEGRTGDVRFLGEIEATEAATVREEGHTVFVADQPKTPVRRQGQPRTKPRNCGSNPRIRA